MRNHEHDAYDVRSVTRENWRDFESFFESIGTLNYCWCMAWRMSKEELKSNDAKNRKELIKNRIFRDIPIGLLAYSEHQVIAWCSVAPRDTFYGLGGVEDIEKVWSITCFFVKREYRKDGLVSYLIEKAKEYAKAKGAQYLEAYPVDQDSPSYRHMGFVQSFEKAGFIFRKKAGTRRNVMLFTL